jgi:hypothetical protein
MGQIVKTTWSGNDDVRGFAGVLEVSLVLLKRHTAKVTPIAQFRLFEIAA